MAMFAGLYYAPTEKASEYYCAYYARSTHTCEDYTGCPWHVGAWSACDVQCGTGTKSRSVWCAAMGDDSLCEDIESKPAEAVECTDYSGCQYEPQPWGECSTACGEGTRQRTVVCQDAMTTEHVGRKATKGVQVKLV